VSATTTAPTIPLHTEPAAAESPGPGLARVRTSFAERRASLALASIALAAFVMGTAELVVVGVLNLIASDLGVSVGRAGLLVTAYAAGISLGGPLLAMLTLRFPRRKVLTAALVAYLAGNALAVVVASFEMLLAARLATGALHGLFIGAAFAVATTLVPAERMGRAISAVFGGIAVSAAVGVPLGTLIGQEFGWQATFAAIVVLGGVALVATLALVPSIISNSGSHGTREQVPHAFAPRVLAVLAVGFLLLGGQFAGLTYLAAFLGSVTGVTGAAIPVFLLCFGVANTAGTVLGGAAADRDAAGTLLRANAVLVVALLALWLGGASPVVTAVALAVWGLVGFGLVPSLQHRVVTLAGPGAELAAALPASAVTAGIAVGSLVGGWAVGPDAGAPIVIALAICATALPLNWLTGRFVTPRAPSSAGSD
jgi:MFS transporter, DHA1 family, inner membrane transport protein